MVQRGGLGQQWWKFVDPLFLGQDIIVYYYSTRFENDSEETKENV